MYLENVLETFNSARVALRMEDVFIAVGTTGTVYSTTNIGNKL